MTPYFCCRLDRVVFRAALDTRGGREAFMREKTREGALSIFRTEKQLPHVYAPHSTHQSAFASTLAR